MYQCPREERVSERARKSTSEIAEGECISVPGKKGCLQVQGRVPLELQWENVSVSQGRKVVFKCKEDYLWNYRGRMYQCPREERLSSSARKSTSRITQGECMSVLEKKGCPQVPGRVTLELQRGKMYQCPREESLSS